MEDCWLYNCLVEEDNFGLSWKYIQAFNQRKRSLSSIAINNSYTGFTFWIVNVSLTQFVLKNEHLNFDTKSFRDEPYFIAKRSNIHWLTHYRKNFFIIWACIILGVKKLWHLLALLGCEGLRFTATYVFHFSRKMQNCIYVLQRDLYYHSTSRMIFQNAFMCQCHATLVKFSCNLRTFKFQK